MAPRLPTTDDDLEDLIWSYRADSRRNQTGPFSSRRRRPSISDYSHGPQRRRESNIRPPTMPKFSKMYFATYLGNNRELLMLVLDSDYRNREWHYDGALYVPKWTMSNDMPTAPKYSRNIKNVPEHYLRHIEYEK